MSFSEEILMAYADGELGEPERSLVERAAREDPEVAASIARHRALRADVANAFAGVLQEPVPARLAPRPAAASASITPLDAARAARAQAAAAPPPPRAIRPRGDAWWRWGGMAASLVIGVLVTSAWLGGAGSGTLVAADDSGRLLARGELARALTDQLAAGNGPVRIGPSFAARDGNYCRSFTMGGTAGLACREGEAWRIPVLKESDQAPGEYRQAGSALPGAVLEAIDERIVGETFDAAAERAARERGWRSATPRP